jgi:hypothetical protein
MANNEERLRQAIDSVMPGLYCPTRRPARGHPPTGVWVSAPCTGANGMSGNIQAGQTDYASCTSYAGGGHRRGSTVHTDCPIGTGSIGLEGIKDGTANVILYAEKRLNTRGLDWYQGDDNEGWLSGWDPDTNRSCTRRPLPDPITGDGEARFGSSHPASFNVVMCDGAVKTFSFKVEAIDLDKLPDDVGTSPFNQTLFNRLGTRDDGLPAEPQ